MSIKEIKNWFEAAVSTPIKDNERIQVGVHFEEICEMLDSLTESSSDSEYRTMISNANQAMRILSNELKKNPKFDLTIKSHLELLDSLCDQIVTATGVAHMYGFDILGALSEVSRSNNSKFEDGKPVFNENGKITKGKDYYKPYLVPFLVNIV